MQAPGDTPPLASKPGSPWLFVVLAILLGAAALGYRPEPFHVYTNDGARELTAAVARLRDSTLPTRGPEIGPSAARLGGGYVTAATLALRVHPSVSTLVLLQYGVALTGIVLLGVALRPRLGFGPALAASLVVASSASTFHTATLLQHSVLLPPFVAIWLAGAYRTMTAAPLPASRSTGWGRLPRWRLVEVTAAVLGSHVHILMGALALVTLARCLHSAWVSLANGERLANAASVALISIVWAPIAAQLLTHASGDLGAYAVNAPSTLLDRVSELGATGLLGRGGWSVLLLQSTLVGLAIVASVRARDLELLLAVGCAVTVVAGAVVLGGAQTRYLGLLTPVVALLVATGLAALPPTARTSSLICMVTLQLVDPVSGGTVFDVPRAAGGPDLLRCESVAVAPPPSPRRDSYEGRDSDRQRLACGVIAGGRAVTALAAAGPMGPQGDSPAPLVLTFRGPDGPVRIANPHVPIAWLEAPWLAALGMVPSPTLRLGGAEAGGDAPPPVELTISCPSGGDCVAPAGMTWVLHVVGRSHAHPRFFTTALSESASVWTLGDVVGVDIPAGDVMSSVTILAEIRDGGTAFAAEASLVPRRP